MGRTRVAAPAARGWRVRRLSVPAKALVEVKADHPVWSDLAAMDEAPPGAIVRVQPPVGADPAALMVVQAAVHGAAVLRVLPDALPPAPVTLATGAPEPGAEPESLRAAAFARLERMSLTDPGATRSVIEWALTEAGA